MALIFDYWGVQIFVFCPKFKFKVELFYEKIHIF